MLLYFDTDPWGIFSRRNAVIPEEQTVKELIGAPADLLAAHMIRKAFGDHEEPFSKATLNAGSITAVEIKDEEWWKPCVSGARGALSRRTDDHPDGRILVEISPGSEVERTYNLYREENECVGIIEVFFEKKNSKSETEFKREVSARGWSDLTLITQLASAASMGLTTVLICNDISRLPKNVICALDQHIFIKAPTLHSIHAIVCKLTSDAPRVSRGVVLRAKPTDFNLALRPDQTSGDYMYRLERQILCHEVEKQKPITKHFKFPSRLSQVAGMDEAVLWGKHLVEDLNEYKRGAISWSEIDRGCVFVGPSGVGKTDLAQLIAREASVHFIAASSSEWQRGNKWDAYLAAQTAAFAEAKDNRPAIILIDELDSYPSRTAHRDQNSTYHTAMVNSLLLELDGVADREGVVVIGATNHIHLVDPAIIRPGRLDRVIEIRRPNFDALKLIFRHYLENELDAIDLDEACSMAVTREATGAKIEQWAREMRGIRRREKRPPTLQDLLNSIRRG